MAGSKVSVIWEFNAYLDSPKASIWIIKGSYDGFNDLEPEDHPNAWRFVGPIEFKNSGELQRQVVKMFEWLGFDVEHYEIADD